MVLNIPYGTQDILHGTHDIATVLKTPTVLHTHYTGWSCMKKMTLTQSGAPGHVLAGPISHTSTQYMDFVEIFNISLDLSTIYIAHFSGCWASFVYSSRYPRIVWPVFWSQVEHKIVSFYFVHSPLYQLLYFCIILLRRRAQNYTTTVRLKW